MAERKKPARRQLEAARLPRQQVPLVVSNLLQVENNKNWFLFQFVFGHSIHLFSRSIRLIRWPAEEKEKVKVKVKVKVRENSKRCPFCHYFWPKLSSPKAFSLNGQLISAN